MKSHSVVLARISRTILFALLGMAVGTFPTTASGQEPAPPLPPPPDPPPPAPEAQPPQPPPPAPYPSTHPPPATGYPPHGYPPHGYPPHGYPPHGYPPYGYAPYGQGYVAPPPPPPPAPPAKPKHAEARADDQVALSAGIFLYNVIGIGMGLQAGLYVAPNTLIDIDFLNAAAVFPDAPRSNSVSLGVRQFASDTFYVRGALRGRMLRTSEWWDFDDDDYEEFVERTDLGLDFALGNRWQFGDLAIGVDWFGVYRPLINLSATGVSQHRATGLENRTDLDEDELELQHDLRLGFFHIGGSF